MSGPGAADRAPTIHDVAALAGVSSQTVVRYVRGFEGIRPVTREKVQRAISELAWHPNPVARALRTSTGNRILLFVYELDEAGPNRIILAATKRAREAGYVLEVVPMDASNPAASRAVLASIDQTYVAGALALAPTEQLAELFDELPFSPPLIREVNGDGLEGPSAQGDIEPGIVEVVEHLYELDHRDLFLIDGPGAWFSARKRSIAATRTARELGMRIVGRAEGDWSAGSGHEVGQGDLAGATAIVAANDEMAIGAMSALRERGIRVPDDVSITGFDDIQLAAYSAPSLTTVRVDFSASGARAVDRLLSLIQGEEAEVGRAIVPSLMVRSSTSHARFPKSARLLPHSEWE